MTNTAECPYCFGSINPKATRCPHCAGEFMYCPKCKANRAITTKNKFVGVLRGGHKPQHSCAVCRRVLAGPRM